MITVLTPSYNRGCLIKNVYYSLIRQTFNDFEWVVIDDGSSDSTSNIVQSLKEEGRIRIVYKKKENGGKHTALNMGIAIAKGDLILIVDSDDSLPKDSLFNINQEYIKIKDDISIGGVCGFMAHHNGTIIGTWTYPLSMDVSSIEIRYKYRFKGDMCEVFKTQVLREFPFPEIKDELFCPEDLVLNRISKKYKLRLFDKVIYYRDYLDGGLTSKIVKIRMKSPVGSMMCYAEIVETDIPFIYKIKAAINYWRFRLCNSGKKTYPKLRYGWYIIAPLGFLLHIKDILFMK